MQADLPRFADIDPDMLMRQKQIAKFFPVSEATLSRLCHKYRESKGKEGLPNRKLPISGRAVKSKGKKGLPNRKLPKSGRAVVTKDMISRTAVLIRFRDAQKFFNPELYECSTDASALAS